MTKSGKRFIVERVVSGHEVFCASCDTDLLEAVFRVVEDRVVAIIEHKGLDIRDCRFVVRLELITGKGMGEDDQGPDY